MNKRWVCMQPNCDQMVTPNDVDSKVHPAYKTLEARAILDFTIVGVVTSDGKLFIEYPRKEFA